MAQWKCGASLACLILFLFVTSKHFKFYEHPLANSPFCCMIFSFKRKSLWKCRWNACFHLKNYPRLHDIQHMKHDNVVRHQRQLIAPDCTLTLDTSFERKGKMSLRRINLRCDIFPRKILETSDICTKPKRNKQRRHFNHGKYNWRWCQNKTVAICCPLLGLFWMAKLVIWASSLTCSSLVTFQSNQGNQVWKKNDGASSSQALWVIVSWKIHVDGNRLIASFGGTLSH